MVNKIGVSKDYMQRECDFIMLRNQTQKHQDITKLVMLSLSYSNTLFEGVLDQIEHKKHSICERQVGHSKL